MPDTDDLSVQERVEKLEKKLKLSNLLTGKKFADLELTIGKLNENIKEVLADFPEIKERSEEIENLLNVINIGIIGYKKNFDDLGSRLARLEKIPEDVKVKLSSYENKLKSLEDNAKKISDSLNAFNTLKDDITRTVEEKILPRIQTLSEDSTGNKAEIKHIKNNIDAFSSALRSFERTVELTNLDVIIKRFDSIEDRLMKTKTQMDELRITLSSTPIKDKDIEVIKQKLRETEGVVLEKLGKLSEVESKINILQQKLDDLNFFDAAKKPGEAPKLDTAATEETYKRMEGMYNDMLKRIADLKSLDKEVRSIELPPSLNQTISKFEERLATLEGNYNEVIKVMEDLMKSVKEGASGTGKVEGMDKLKKDVEDIREFLTSWNKNITDYRKQLEKRIDNLGERRVAGGIPKNLIDELSSLKELMTRLSTENKEFKRVARDIRLSQMASVEPETFAGIANKVSLLEKKIVELEEKMSKKPSIKEEKPEDVNKLKREVEEKIKEIEMGLEGKIKQIEKKMGEESSVKPIILE